MKLFTAIASLVTTASAVYPGDIVQYWSVVALASYHTRDLSMSNFDLGWTNPLSL